METPMLRLHRSTCRNAKLCLLEEGKCSQLAMHRLRHAMHRPPCTHPISNSSSNSCRKVSHTMVAGLLTTSTPHHSSSNSSSPTITCRLACSSSRSSSNNRTTALIPSQVCTIDFISFVANKGSKQTSKALPFYCTLRAYKLGDLLLLPT